MGSHTDVGSPPIPDGEAEAGLPTAVPIPAEIAALLEDLEAADAAELDRRLHAAVRLEKRFDARVGSPQRA